VVGRGEGDAAARLERRVVRVAAGAAHSVALTAGGKVATFGSNSDGQLGRAPTATAAKGSNSNSNTAVGWVAELRGVRQVAAGRAHSMAVDDEGCVWGWGCGVGGRLGTGCNTVRPSETHIEIQGSY
jgi:alpha-tubulin suppressor-like RCC1 family protein